MKTGHTCVLWHNREAPFRGYALGMSMVVSPTFFPAVVPPLRASVRERIAAAGIALACLSVLIVAAVLQPSTDGFGTHRQLGLPPCGWVLAFGKPCMTCSMTTAFSHMARGHVISGFVTQPMGAFLAIIAASTVWAGAYSAIFGSRIGWLCGKLFTGRIMWPFLGFLLAAWVYKIVTWPT